MNGTGEVAARGHCSDLSYGPVPCRKAPSDCAKTACRSWHGCRPRAVASSGTVRLWASRLALGRPAAAARPARGRARLRNRGIGSDPGAASVARSDPSRSSAVLLVGRRSLLRAVRLLVQEYGRVVAPRALRTAPPARHELKPGALDGARGTDQRLRSARAGSPTSPRSLPASPATRRLRRAQHDPVTLCFRSS
jgi:hypothetical protein